MARTENTRRIGVPAGWTSTFSPVAKAALNTCVGTAEDRPSNYELQGS